MDRLFLAAVVVIVAFVSGCVVQPQQQIPQPEATQQPIPEEVPAQQPGNETASAVIKTSEDAFGHVNEPHWAHMPVTYSVLNDGECGSYESARIRRAFSEIMNATNNVVSFRKANSTEPADITISCIFVENCYKTSVETYADYSIRYETICGHDLGVTSTTLQDNRIVKADIELFGLAGFAETDRQGPSGFYVGTCGHTITEVHELLHAFGYRHSTDNSSIMYPEADTFSLITQKAGACIGSSRAIDKAVVDDLVRTYSGRST